MAIKNFDEFTESLTESSAHHSSYSYTDYYGGKTKFSKWLRSVASNLKWDAKDVQSSADSSHLNTSNRAKAFFSVLGKLIFSGGAAIADFFSKGDSKDTFSKMPKSEIKKNKQKVLDSWEKDNLEGKTISQQNAEDFYKSGVLKGKKYFGKEYNPSSPKNDDEREYSDYLTGAMSRYYNRINTPSDGK